MLKSKISNPTRYSLVPGTSTPLKNVREQAREGVDVDDDTYLASLKSRYVTALEN